MTTPPPGGRRILFVAAREQSYARNEVMIRALRCLGTVEVIAPLAQQPSLLQSSVQMGRRADRLLRRQRFDLLVVGFYGHLILRGLRLPTGLPVLFDAFVSTYDTLVEDRGTYGRDSLPARLALWLDRSACARADQVLLDTTAHVEYFADFIGVERAKLHALPVGCNEQIFRPSTQPESTS
ncbi:MAG: glycosyltransferase, partial [Caldilineaceae bacterium]